MCFCDGVFRAGYIAVVRAILPAVLLAGEGLAAMDRAAIEAGLLQHDRAVHITDGWIRDPYIVLGADGYYYLTGTTPRASDPRRADGDLNTGLGRGSIVGWTMSLWRSRDLIDWEDLGTPYSLKDGIWYKARPERFRQVQESEWRMWAPEVHWFDGRWVIVHTSPGPVAGANLSVTRGAQIEGPYENPMGAVIGRRHDPSLFRDDDGAVWMVWGATQIAPLKADLSGFAGEAVAIGPANHKMGHEGCLIRKIGGKYVLFGTGWSTDAMRKGTYNLYYCTADKITGPYGPRRFAGRFLGHGTPFRDKQGRWWCTAFYNANVPPLSREEARSRSLADNAYTINRQGVTLTPLGVKVLDDGEVHIRAKDPDYARPGPEEIQQFEDVPARGGPVGVIFDTDLDSDVDDVGALAVLHALADRGEARILGVIVTSDDVHAPLCADALNTYFGRPDIPVGVCKGQALRSFSRYTKAIAEEFPHDLKSYEEAEDGAALYRRLLTEAADDSVVIVTVGHLTNLKNLLLSEPDLGSPLDGVRLVERKVKLWSCMGGNYPRGKEPNFYRPDPEATAVCVGRWPGRVVFSGGEIGTPIKTGGAVLKERGAAGSPVRRGYELYNQFAGRSSWDQTAVLIGVRGCGDLWSLHEMGYNHVFADGSNEWRAAPDKAHAYVVEKMRPAEVAEVIDALMLHEPRR